eukprot:2343953-Lingulodinium_polyedra.AAC.1
MRRSDIVLRCPICRLDEIGHRVARACLHGFTTWCHRGCGRPCEHGNWPDADLTPCPECPPPAPNGAPAAATVSGATNIAD